MAERWQGMGLAGNLGQCRRKDRIVGAGRVGYGWVWAKGEGLKAMGYGLWAMGYGLWASANG